MSTFVSTKVIVFLFLRRPFHNLLHPLFAHFVYLSQQVVRRISVQGPIDQHSAIFIDTTLRRVLANAQDDAVIFRLIFQQQFCSRFDLKTLEDIVWKVDDSILFKLDHVRHISTVHPG